MSSYSSDSDDCSSDPDSCASKPNCYPPKEKPVKPGFERTYVSCGSYYDKPIVGEGQERCDGCSYPFQTGTLDTSGATAGLVRVCEKCLENKKIGHCCKCNVFVRDIIGIALGNSQFGSFYKRCKKIRCGNAIYCDKCMPPILFYMDVGRPYYRTIEIPIPTDKESGLPFNYFFDAVAEKLGISVDRIMISGRMKDPDGICMLCPAEYEKIEHKTFKVTICD